jgi:predicted dehydrogenase
MRVGVVGLGFGAAVHVPALQRLDGIEVVALAGSNRAGAQAAAAAAGVALGCGSVDELLEQRLDAVTIAVPPDRQAELAAAVLAAGVPVLAEKPLAASVDEAERLAELATSVTTMIDFELAELRSFRTLRETLLAGAYGSVRSVDVLWLRRPRAGRDRVSWKEDPARGGGVLAQFGSHVLYLLDWLLGPIEAIAGEGSGTRLVLTCRAGGVPVSVTLDNDADEHRHEWRIELTDDTLMAFNRGPDVAQGFRLVAASGAVLAEEPADSHPDGRVAVVSTLAARFVAAAAEGRQVRPSFADGLRVQRLMAEIGRAQVAAR